jgi:hypothetical protein
MWLLKDERKLLTVYYLKIIEPRSSEEITKEKWYRESSLVETLRAKNVRDAAKNLKDYLHGGTKSQNEKSQDEGNIEELKKGISEYIQYLTNFKIANNALSERKLIKTRDHETVVEDKPIGISLTIEGYDLGKKYSSWWTRSGLWFAEYKNHWIWLIVSFLGGIIGGLLINWLS